MVNITLLTPAQFIINQRRNLYLADFLFWNDPGQPANENLSSSHFIYFYKNKIVKSSYVRAY